MKTIKNRSLLLLALAVAGIAATQDAARGQAFTILDDPFAQNQSHQTWCATYPQGISGSTVAGYYDVYAAPYSYGFIYSGGTFTTLTGFESRVVRAKAFGVSGSNVTGIAYYTAPNAPLVQNINNGLYYYCKSRGFIYSGGVINYFDAPAGAGITEPAAISGGTVVGHFYDQNSKIHGFIYNGGTWTTLDPPSPTLINAFATGISGSTVVGSFCDNNTGNWHGFIYSGGVWTILDAPGSSNNGTQAVAISGSNILVHGNYSTGGKYFIYNGGVYYPLVVINAPANAILAPTGIDGDTVTGYFYYSTGVYDGTHGFLAKYSIFVISGSSLPTGVIGAPYSQTLQAVNGTQPFNWTIVSGALPSGLTLGAASGTISGTPTAAGTATFSVQVTDANGLSAQQAFTLVITSPYAAWLAANNLPADGSGNGALTACPAGDGITNLAKFALGIAANTPGYQGRFSTATATDNGKTYLSLTYTRPDPAPAGVSYTAESGGDLTPGSLSNASALELPSSPSGGLRTITVRDTTAIGTTPHRFLRLRFTAP